MENIRQNKPPEGDDPTAPAPDSDEPGDEELPEELQEHIEEGAVPPDNVDQEG